MILNCTNVFDRNWAAFRDPAKRYAKNEGGSSSSKTYSILQLLIILALYSKTPLLISVISESMPHLKRGCLRDFKKIMGDAYDARRFSKTEYIYDFGKNKYIEFFSADDEGKLRGGRRDIAYFNEINNVTKDSRDQVDMRTERFVFSDWNPTGEFFEHEELRRPDVAYIHSTYKDAIQFLPPSIVKKLESYRELDPNNWRIYGEGLLGLAIGLVHPVFTQCDELPESDEPFYGLDFGYTNSKTAMVKCVLRGDEFFSQQLIYETGLKARDILARFEALGVPKGSHEIFADSEDPRLIDEIFEAGYNIRGVNKRKDSQSGKDFVPAGIDRVNGYRQVWTKDSLDGIKEQRNYGYKRDKNGKLLNEPIKLWDHLMDARRYALMGKIEEGFAGGVTTG